VSSVNLVSKRYAKALFIAANNSKSMEKVSSSLFDLSRVFQDMPVEIRRVFLDPTVSRKDLTLCFSSFLKGLPTIFNNFCNILVNEGRLSFVNEIHTHFQILLMSYRNQSEVDVWSAYKLGKDFYQKLEKILSGLLNKKVSLNIHIDPLLLGGIVIEVDGFRVDSSVLGNLNQLNCYMKGAR
jgi:ATP synthase F1 delta subunit